MKIKIQTSEELDRLLDALAQEIVDAQIYHRLFCALVDAIVERLDGICKALAGQVTPRGVGGL